MAIQIFSVSSSINTDKGWQAVVHYFDLKDKGEALRKLSPLSEIPRIPIGAKIEEDGTISKSAGESEHIVFSNFNNGKIISIEELSNSLYPFNVSKEVVIDTKLYIVYNGGLKPYVFFCYELFRTFLCLDNRIVPYLYQYDVLESFINAEEITEEGGFRSLYLELSDNFPKALLSERNKGFIDNFILILYNSTIREYWKSVQANSTISKSDFSFDSIGLDELDLTCRVKEYEDFKLIYNIEEINSTIELPFDELELVHSSFKEKHQKKQKPGERQKFFFDVKLPTSHSVENETIKTTDYSESISVLPLKFRYDRRMKIKRLKLSQGKLTSTSESKSVNSFPKLNLGDQNVGFNNYGNDEEGESFFLSLTRNEGFNNFDYSQIPEGLVFFSKAIDLLARKVKLRYTYELWHFATESSFGRIGDIARKVLIIEIKHSPSIYLIEIDSSDNKFVSTLVISNLRISNNDEFFEKVLDMTCERNGVWPEEYLNKHCEYAKIKHPKMTKSLKSLPVEKRNEVYIQKLAYKIVKGLV